MINLLLTKENRLVNLQINKNAADIFAYTECSHLQSNDSQLNLALFSVCVWKKGLYVYINSACMGN